MKFNMDWATEMEEISTARSLKKHTKKKLTLDWAMEMEETGTAMGKPKQPKERTKKSEKLAWVYAEEPNKKGYYDLVDRNSNVLVDRVEELHKFIMEGRYGDKAQRMAARKKPVKAMLVISDYLAGRPFELEPVRMTALGRLLEKEAAAKEELERRKTGVK
jgi:hypothetical protein